VTTHKTEPAPEPAPAEPGSRDPLTRLIAISLASVVVLGGLLATLQTDASVQESTTARETTRVAVRALRANVTENAVVDVEAELQGERDFLASRRPLTADASSLTGAVGLPRDRAGLARDLRTAAEGLPLPRAAKAIDQLRYETARATLRQQALATTRITWNTRSTQYTTVIAVLAAALFLVGFGLIVEGRLRVYSYGLGMIIAFTVAVLGAWLYHLPIPSTPEGAIDAAAQAATSNANRDYKRAIAQYGRALAIDDEYAAAYRGRAIARLLAANPDYQVTRAFTDLDGRSSSAAILDAERALDLEQQQDFLGLALVALQAFYNKDFEKATASATAAIEINPEIPDVRLLKSAAEVALGEPKAARDSLDNALELLRGTEPSQRNRLLASTYLSYLEWVSWSVPEQADEADQLANEVVATETAFTLGRTVSRTLPSRGGVTVEGLRFAAGRLRLVVRYRDLPARTALSALEYERPIENGPWAQPTDLALFQNMSGSGARRFSIPLQRGCAPTEVRVDVYLNGAPALSQTGPGVPSTC
jgi:tetratricopeptide (TPR) repeat protein